MADVESLALQITGDVQSAEKSIDSLIQTLGRLKTAAQGGSGLRGIANPLQKISTAINSLSGTSQKLNDLAGGLKTLSGASNFKISANIANQITAIGNAIKNSPTDYSSITNMFAAVQPLANLAKGGLGTLISQIKKLPEAAEALDKLDLNSFGAKISELATKMRPLADEMQKVANGFSAFPAKALKFAEASDKMAAANNASTLSFAKLATKVTAAVYSLKRITDVVGSWVTQSNNYIENLNLFAVAMGEYGKEAKQTAEEVSKVLGIDPSTWLRNQGVFMTLATGFGVVGDRASVMSEQLTQLGYDISSFFNISVEDAMQKLQSGISGELEPLRRLGYDLSQAKLEATALSLGIDKAVSSMTQAEKAELRYYAIMTQVTTAQGDMARTLSAPANQLRILEAQLSQAARALGNMFIPALAAVLPYAIALVQVITLLANAIASLFGYEINGVDWGENITAGAGGASDAIDKATGSAKKLKKTLLGIDELNVLTDNSSGGGGDVDYGGGGFGFELPTYDIIGEATNSKVNEIVEEMKDWLGISGEINSMSDLLDTRLGEILVTVGLIGAALSAWNISTNVLKALKDIKKLTSKKINLSFSVLGVTLAMSDLDKLKQYFEDFAENGPTFKNVSGMLSEFAGLIGDAMILLGHVQVGGAMKVVQGIGEIVSSINSMATEGIDVTNTTDLIRGLTNIAIGIGAFTGKLQIAGWAAAIQGFTTVIQELAENWDAIKQGDWSGVDKTTLIIGAIEAIGGILVALDVFKKLKDSIKGKEAVEGIKEVATATETISTTTSSMTGKLTNLVKDLGLGIAIIGEVAAAAALFVGAIWVLGKELEQVGIACEPVIANGETIAIAVGIGTGVLVGIGVVAAALGTAGTPLIVNIALGTAILGEIGVAAALFLAEILIVGQLLDEIGIAWEPVLNNGETIATGIGIGTGILIAIGVVAAALGAATIATGALLPIAIGLGAALLAELGVAASAFLTAIRDVAGYLEDIGENWQPVLDNGETIKQGISTGTDLLIGIGAVAAVLGTATVASVGLLPVAIKLGGDMMYDLSDAFGKFSKSLSEVAGDIKDVLAPALAGVNDVLPGATSDMGDFVKFMTKFAGDMVVYSASSVISTIASTIDKFLGYFTEDPVKRLVREMDEQYDDMVKLQSTLTDITPVIEDVTDKMKDYNDAMTDYNKATGNYGGGIVDTIVKIGVEVVNDASKWWANVKSWWNDKVGSVSPFSTSVSNNSSTWWSNVKSWWNSVSSGGVAAKVNAEKGSGWSSIKNWVGDLTAKLGITFPRFRLKWSETTILGVKAKYPSGFETYAKGGFPDMGQLFIAREAGPELVGSIGGRTAVANNDQIVEAVSRGVYQAVVSAMGQSGGTQVVEAKVNDKVLFEVVVDRNRQETMRTGYSPLLGGV